MKKIQHRSNAGFTLLELLVVIAILAILFVMGLRAFGEVREKSRDSRRKQDLHAISKALEMYHNDMGRYPANDAAGRMMGCHGAALGDVCDWGAPFINANIDTLYMSQLPQDPGGARYFYQQELAGQGYQLFAFLENKDDPQATEGIMGPSCGSMDGTWISGSCRYVVKSTNLN